MSTVVDTPARVAEMLGRRKTEAISLDGILSLPPLEFAAEAKSMDLEAQLAALQPVVFEERRFKAGDLVALVRLRESILTALHSDCNRVKTSLDAVLGTVPNLSTGSSTALTKPTEATLKAVHTALVVLLTVVCPQSRIIPSQIHCHQGFLDLADLVNQARQRDDGLVEVLSVVQLKKTIVRDSIPLSAPRCAVEPFLFFRLN